MKFTHFILAILLMLTALWFTSASTPSLLADSVQTEGISDSPMTSSPADEIQTSSSQTSFFEQLDRMHAASALAANKQHQAFSNFLANWQNSQQRFLQHQQEWMKQHKEQYCSYHHQQVQCQLNLSPHPHPFGSGKPCKLYYVFAMRHIVI